MEDYALHSKTLGSGPVLCSYLGMRRHDNQARENKHATSRAGIKVHGEDDLAALLQGKSGALVLILD
ncbi:MAG TPA: hypothetical protein VGH65_10680, partial [Verrucomicrobiaceae bacterium]